MSLFAPKSGSVFLKEDSTTAQQIAELKAFQAKATGKLKDDIARELTLASYGEVGEKNIAYEVKSFGLPLFIIHDLHFINIYQVFVYRKDVSTNQFPNHIFQLRRTRLNIHSFYFIKRRLL